MIFSFKNNSGISQNLIQIEKINDDVVYLKDGSLCKIIMVSSINFDLKSEEEKELILNNFKNFLNSLNFPIQIFIHSRQTNIENYISYLEKRKKEEENELLKIQIEDYINFVQEFVKNNNIFSKNFFVVVKHTPLIIKEKNFLSIFSNKSSKAKIDEVLEDQQDIENLNQKSLTIIEGLENIGLKTIILEKESLLELFYNLYNPKITDKKIK